MKDIKTKINKIISNSIIFFLIFSIGIFIGKYITVKEIDGIYKDISMISKINPETFLEVNSLLYEVYGKKKINIKEYNRKIMYNIVKEYSKDNYAEYISSNNNYLEKTLNGKYDGLGIIIGQTDGNNNLGTQNKQLIENTNKIDKKTVENKNLIINDVFNGSPAEKSNLKEGDIIENINGKEINNTKDFKEEIQNSKNIKLIINRDGKKIKKDIIREKIYLPTIYGDILEYKNKKILYIKILAFGDNTDNEIKSLIETKFKKQNIDGYVLDVTNNGGGQLSSTEEILNLFIPKGKEMYSIYNSISKEDKTFYSKEQFDLFKPTIIIINNKSASASELLALSLKNSFGDKVLIIGEQSFGKGTFQTMYELSNGDFLKMTLGKWFVNNKSINKIGIEPEIKINMNQYGEIPNDILLKNLENFYK